MTVFLRDTPIKRKLMLVILLTSSFALVLMAGTLITYELVTFRQSLAVNMGVLAKIVGSNSTAAIAFNDPKNAREILGALSAEHQITAAAIYDQRGNIFAHFPASVPLSDFPVRPGIDGHRFERGHLVMFQPILQEGTRLGTIYVQADLGQMYSRFRVYGALLLFVTACASLGAIALTTTLQRRITLPLLELAKVATAVSDHQDYSVRATKHGTDEIGQLTDAFNQMLTRIGSSNAALTASEERLRLALDVSKQNEEDLSRAKQAAEAANKAKDNFLAILSHELRTPLTPVLATIAMLEEDENLPSYFQRELELIRRNIEVEARLIDDLLDVNGIARGKLELRRQVVDLRTLLEHAMQNYCAGEATKKNLRVSIAATATETHVLADASRMTQVLWNLLQNACKFTPEGGEIAVRVYNDLSETRPCNSSEPIAADQTGSRIVVEISDNGIGIMPENMPTIFNAFEQGEHSRTRTFGGLGLGLAISRAIVEMHGGSISAKSEGREKGTTLTVRLPTARLVDGANAARKSRPTHGIETSSRSLRVLLVEDHPDTAKQLKRLLNRAGHEVICAGSLREARALINATSEPTPAPSFDILISDLGLPDGSGHELMRDLAPDSRIPGIALSGYGMNDDVRDSIAAGFSRHLTKPVDWQELKVAIQNIAAEHI